MKVKIIYSGRFIPDLAIAQEGHVKGWLLFKHPDGQWVTLVDLKQHIEDIK